MGELWVQNQKIDGRQRTEDRRRLPAACLPVGREARSSKSEDLLPITFHL